MNDWSMLRKLIWLHVISGGGSSGARTTVTGASPLALVNALAKPIRSLIQYGKVTTSNGDMYCNNGKLVAVDDELSVVGTPEVLTVGEQTASVENLLAVDDIKDEQNIISGAVIRRCEAVISDGTTPSGRYIGEVGEGNIIVKVRETGYEGDVATFEADRVAPLNGLTVNVEPIQAGTGDPSPDNVRPISGRTSATVTRTGVNIWDEEWEVGGINSSTGQNNNETNLIRSKNYIPVKPGMAIWVQSPDQGTTLGNLRSRYYDINKQYLGMNPTMNVRASIEIPDNCYFVRFACQPYYGTTYNNDISINYPATDTQYHPYAGNTYTIALGDTVYGGTLDVTNGVLTVDRAMVVYDGSEDENWSKRTSGSAGAYGMIIRCDGLKFIGSNDISVYSNYLMPIKLNSTWGNYDAFISSDSANTLVTGIRTITTVAAWKTYLASNPLQVLYFLATPIEITLTPTQIETLMGQNNVWSDTGSVKAYVADGDVIEHVTAQPLRTAEGSNTVSVTSAVAPVQLSATYTASE